MDRTSSRRMDVGTCTRTSSSRTRISGSPASGTPYLLSLCDRKGMRIYRIDPSLSSTGIALSACPLLDLA